MTNCPAEYTNLGEDAFGDEKDVTDDMLRSFCRSLAWLKAKAEELEDKTDPVVREPFTPIRINSYASYGVALDSGDNTYKFDNSTSLSYTESFEDLDGVIKEISTARHLPELGAYKKIPSFGAEGINTDCPGPWGAYRCNTHWYIGWNKDEPFHLDPEWLDDKFAADMPSLARAQTFTSTKTEKLTKVTLDIHGNADAEDSLYVEIRNTVNGAPGDTVICRMELPLRDVKPGLQAFPVEHGPILTSGTKYTIVVRAPFASFRHHYGLGGWGRNCNADPYATGDAFTSWDNGHSWMKHGKDENLPYEEGQWAPQDFCFIIHTQPLTETYSSAVADLVYIKPVRTNPIKRVVVAHTATIPAGTSLKFYVTKDFVTWTEVNEGNAWQVNYSAPYPLMVWVKVELRTDSGHTGNTPILESVTVHLDTNRPTDGYILTEFYNPRTAMPLGASIWSGVDAPVTLEPNTTCLVDIIRNTIKSIYIVTDGSEDTFSLGEFIANPVINVVLAPTADTPMVEYVEFKDYVIDYDETANNIVFRSAPAAGVLKINCYPVWIRAVPQTDLPLKCDLFEETFTGNGATTNYALLVKPVLPLREVTVDDVIQLYGVDYTFDMDTNEIVFPTFVEDGAVIATKYTPYLIDTGLAIAYHLSRTNTNNQVAVEGNYFEYRV